jgi:hypothetical protein
MIDRTMPYDAACRGRVGLPIVPSFELISGVFLNSIGLVLGLASDKIVYCSLEPLVHGIQRLKSQ